MTKRKDRRARKHQMLRRRRQDDHKQRNQDAASFAPSLAKRGPTDPHRIAKSYLHQVWRENNLLTLHHWNGDFWKWTGAKYVRISPGDCRALITEFSKRQLDALSEKTGKVAA